MNVMTIFKRIFLISATLLIGITYSYGQSDKYIEALRYYQNEELSKAKALLLQEIADNPDNDAAYYYTALILSRDESNKVETEQYLKKALEIDPGNYWYKYYLALFYANTDRIELTTVLLEDLIAEYPKKSDLYFDAVNAYLNQNDMEKALNTLDKIEAINGKNEIIGLTKMDLLLKQAGNKESDAYAFLEEYYKDCKTPRIAAMIGDYYVRMYNDSTALSYYDQALDLNPDYTPAYYGKAHIYQILRKYDKYFESISHFIKDANIRPEAKVEYLNDILSSSNFMRAFGPEVDSMMVDVHLTHPKDSTINTLLGLYYYQTERQYLSIEVLRQNHELYPESKNATMQYAMILYYCQVWDELINVVNPILANQPGDIDLLQLRAIANWQSGNEPGAIDDYLRLTKLAPKDSAVTVFANSALGDLYHLSNQSKKAYQHYEKALKANPDYAPVLNNYAYYLSEEGKSLKKAQNMSRKTVEQEPDNPTYLDTYAWILHLLGQDVEAKALFKHAMLYGGKESAVILDHYAEVLYSLKEYDLAYIYWNQANSLDNTLGIDRKVKQKKQEQPK